MKVLLLTITGVILCRIIWPLNYEQVFIVGLELFWLLYFLSRVGRKFVFLEALALIAVTQWLFAPMIADWNGLEMDVPYAQYMRYAIPATLAYVVGITLPLWRQRNLDWEIQYAIDSLSEKYKTRHQWGIMLMIAGLISWAAHTVVPVALGFILYLCAQLLMIGMCLLLFSEYKWKWLWLLGGLLVLVYTTLLNGMIGTVLFWILILGVVYFSNHPLRLKLLTKSLIFFVTVYVIIALQVAKTEYRLETWDITKSEVSVKVSREVEKDPELFYALIKKRLFDLKSLTDPQSALALAERLNQGMLVTSAMSYVPRIRPFGDGEVTLKNTLVAFVPRIVWPQKPFAGQAVDYFKKYTGIQLGAFTSATLGPIGDAYVDFGRWGILFLFFYGLLISQLFVVFVKKSLHTPGILLWFMVLYFGSITVSEVSVAAYLNLVFKYIVFIYAMRLILSHIFKIKV